MNEANEHPGNAHPGLPAELEAGPPGFVFYRGSIPFTDYPFPSAALSEDFEWASRNPELHRQYQGRVVAVHNRKVWGVGKDGNAAWEDARAKIGCPAMHELAFVALIGMPVPADKESRSAGE